MAAYSQTPVTTDPYDRFMIEGFSDMDVRDLPTGALSFFGRGAGKTYFSPTASVVDIDIRRGTKTISALVPRGGITSFLDSADTDATRYTTFSRTFPLGIEIGNIEAAQLDTRAFGEQPYSTGDRLTRLRALAMEHHEEQVRRMVGMWELLAWQSLQLGTMDAIIGTSNADEQYDFHRKTTHTFTAAASWANAGTDIEGDLVTAANLVREDSGLMPDFAIVGTTGINGIMANTALLLKAETRRVFLVGLGDVGPVPPQLKYLVDNGFIYRGYIETNEGYMLHLFTYLGTYTDGTSTATRYLGVDTCIVGASGARCDRLFGPPERLPVDPARQQQMQFYMGFDQTASVLPPKASAKGQIIPASAFHFDAYVSGRNTFSVETQTAPIFVPVNTDAYVTIDVTP